MNVVEDFMFRYLILTIHLHITILKVPLESDPKSKYPVFQLRSREIMGETTKTQEEFEAWIAEQNEGPFQYVGKTTPNTKGISYILI